MKIVCAPDSFKESMTAAEAAASLTQGIRRVLPDAVCLEIPMADGGEGFTESLTDALGARRLDVAVQDSLDRQITGQIAVTQKIAVIEIAEAVGLGLVPPAARNIRKMTSYGVGQLITAALTAGVSQILIGLGGSGTNDGGAGMLRALGVHFISKTGAELDGSPASLPRLARIDTSGLDPRLAKVNIRIACDVDNPLFGDNGAAAVFAPQKGATPEDVAYLDGALRHLAEVATHTDNYALMPGAGAAGGLGYAFAAFLGAELQSGVDLVADTVGLAEAILGADCVFTGEGALDRQTLMGKTLSGVARVATAHNVPLIAFTGKIGEGAEELYEHGFSGLVPIVAKVGSLEEALTQGPANLADAAERATRLLVAGSRILFFP